MVFKKLKASLGLGGGANVETELASADVRPGETVSGVVTITAGELEQSVKYLEIALQARVEVETDDAEYDANRVFHRHRVADAFELAPGDERRVEFALTVPFETPFNVVGGQALPKVEVGVKTELEIARAVDSTDVDPLRVHALAVQEAVLDAIGRLGFRFAGADLEDGRIPGAELSFYEEVEFHGSSRFPGINELEVTFLSGAAQTEVILEADRRGGLLSSGGDSFQRLTVPNEGHGDLEAQLEAAVTELGRRRGLFG